MREALECSAVRLAAERAGEGEIAALRDIVRRQQAARDARDLDGFVRLDDELHETLCAISGHAVAWTVVQRINAHLKRIRRLSVPQPDYIAKMVAEHEEVVEAVARHDADAAEAALRHHLRMVLSGLPAIRSDHPEYFEGG